MLSALGVIPARLQSTRLKEKVLQPIQGKPMIQHVWERVKQARKLSDVVVACDDARIEKCVRDFGGKAVMTRVDHANGTSRVAEAAQKSEAEVVINIQGDEPTIHPEAIDRLVDVFERDAAIQVGTLAVRRTDAEEFENPNVVKVVCGDNGDALYFSRSPIPYYREGKGRDFSFLKHLGIYGYRKTFLLEMIQWEPGTLENTEKLEQLRILQRGFKIRVVETQHNSWSVDTADDLMFVQNKLSGQGAY